MSAITKIKKLGAVLWFGGILLIAMAPDASAFTFNITGAIDRTDGTGAFHPGRHVYRSSIRSAARSAFVLLQGGCLVFGVRGFNKAVKDAIFNPGPYQSIHLAERRTR
jgi:hypothetical protein